MIIKSRNTTKTTLSSFDLLGNDEVALAKAFAFLLGSDKDCYFEFIKFLGVRQTNSGKNFFNSDIRTEKKRTEGRTDIELKFGDLYHIIVECKVRGSKLRKQRTQYLTAFKQATKKKILCFLTQERDTNKQIANDVSIINTSWLDIIELFNSKHFSNKPLVKSFLNFATKNYKMKQLKEILIQDLDSSEIYRYETFDVYRRDETFGTPIYFAPYFIKGAGKVVGITNLSKILGILTLKPNDILNFKSDLESFANNPSQVDRWIKGVQHGKDKQMEIYTYYFLDKPLKLKTALIKDSGIEKGRGKNWIAAHITPNRCVTFTDFIKHIPELV
jgi:hypothetical protein